MSFVFFSTVVTLTSVRSDCQEGEGKGGEKRLLALYFKLWMLYRTVQGNYEAVQGAGLH